MMIFWKFLSFIRAMRVKIF